MVKNNNKTMDNKTAITELMEIVEMDANNGVEISMGYFIKCYKTHYQKNANK